jgi:uncharacterized protein (TIGR00251 family)
VEEVKIRLPLKVIPSASRDAVAGWLGDALKVRVTAPPERGKANAAVERVVAKALGLRPECARISSGTTSARKVIEITGLSEAEARRRISEEEPQ